MIIFYYTGTGNSLALAKRIGGELISISQIDLTRDLSYKSDIIGVVFPIYLLEPPKIVKEFLSKVTFEAEYIFAIGTYGNSDIGCMDTVQSIAKKNGYSFDYTNTLLTVDNYLPMFETKKQIENLKKKNTHECTDNIVNDILSLRKMNLKSSVVLRQLLKVVKPFGNLLLNEKSDKNYKVNENCTRCGICKKVCPANNIEIEEEVEFKHNCQNCMACIHLCPENAIHVKKEKSNARWLNPDVTISEIINANQAD